MNRLVVSMPIGFPEKRKKQQERVNALKQRNSQIYRQLLPTAIESFEKFPNTQKAINQYLLGHIQFQLTGRQFRQIPFNPLAAQRSFKRLRDGGVDVGLLSLYGYRINYILNDFEQARQLAIEAHMRGQKVEQALMEDLRAVTASWNRELEFRKKEAEKDDNPRVLIETDIGDIVVELFEDSAPNTVANFVFLVEQGFYNGLTFYQVSVGEVAIAGSPSDDGLGGPGYTIKCECELESAREHFTGVISLYPLARDRGGSRFLITKQPRLDLNGKITPFGRVIEGMENVYKIPVVNKTVDVGDGTLPAVIRRMSVVRKRDHEYKPEKNNQLPQVEPVESGG